MKDVCWVQKHLVAKKLLQIDLRNRWVLLHQMLVVSCRHASKIQLEKLFKEEKVAGKELKLFNFFEISFIKSQICCKNFSANYKEKSDLVLIVSFFFTS